jgi:hypothetical protein
MQDCKPGAYQPMAEETAGSGREGERQGYSECSLVNKIVFATDKGARNALVTAPPTRRM